MGAGSHIEGLSSQNVSGTVGDITAVNTTLPLTGGSAGPGAVTLDINAFTGDSGLGGLEGTVPAPAAGDSGKFLRGDGTWGTLTYQGIQFYSGVGSPEGVQAAWPGSTYYDTVGAKFYTKVYGTGNTGWIDDGTTVEAFYSGAGSPEGVQTATTGDIYLNTTDLHFWQLQAPDGNTGWVDLGTTPPPGKKGAGDISSVAITTTTPMTGGASFASGAASFTLNFPNMVGDGGAGGTRGAVPAPAAGDAAALKFLKADGTWAVPAGGVGGSGTTNQYPIFTAATTLGDSNLRQSGGGLFHYSPTGSPALTNGEVFLGLGTMSGARVGISFWRAGSLETSAVPTISPYWDSPGNYDGGVLALTGSSANSGANIYGGEIKLYGGLRADSNDQAIVFLQNRVEVGRFASDGYLAATNGIGPEVYFYTGTTTGTANGLMIHRNGAALTSAQLWVSQKWGTSDGGAWRLTGSMALSAANQYGGVILLCGGGRGDALNKAIVFSNDITEAMRIANGGLVSIQNASPGTGNYLSVGAATTADTTTDTIFSTTATTKKALVLQAKAGQTANIFETQISTGAVGFFVTPAGWPQAPGHARVSSNVTNATAAMANITGLSATLVAGRKYAGRYVFYCNEDVAADGLAFDLDGGSATWTSVRIAYTLKSSDGISYSMTSAVATDFSVATVTGDATLTIDFSGIVNAAGTLIPRVSQAAHTTGTATVYANSVQMLQDIP